MARPTVFVAVLVLMALTVAACGGTAPTATAAPTATPIPKAGPTETPTLPTATPYPPSTIVTFPDENLETVIRDTLGKEAGEEITAGELAELTGLDANGGKGNPRFARPQNRVPLLAEDEDGDRGISDLSGIRYCTNLTWLLLQENQISDLTPLVSLTKLTKLWLGSNELSDLSPLASLTNLDWLVLSANPISDISPLASLTNLTILSLFANQIGDLSPLASLTNLTRLTLTGNQISDISPLVENSGLGEGDLVFLQSNPLDLSEGSEDLENIRQLEARRVGVHPTGLIPTPTSPPPPMPTAMSAIVPAQPPPPTPTARPTIVPAQLPTPTVVTFPDANLEAAIREALGTATGEAITVAELASLSDLNVSRRGITITNLSGIQYCINLTTLHLTGNQISDISPLASLTNLIALLIEDNQISDISALVENSGLGEGDTVNLEGNNLDLSEGSEDMENIRLLEARGVDVRY